MPLELNEFIDELFWEVPHDGTRFAIESMLASMIVGTWTAFETLAADMWVAAVNCHPKILAGLGGSPQAWQNSNSRDDEHDDPDGEQKQPKREDKKISLGLLQGKMDQLTGSFGTLLKGRYSFQTLPVIRKAYGLAFSKDFSAVKDALVHTSLDHLAGVRNILVHRSGKADSKFKRQTDGCHHFSRVQAGDIMQLDGDIVCDIVSNATVQAKELIVAVDQWIVDH